MAFRDENVALRERLNALEKELEEMQSLPEELSKLRAERDALAKQVAKHESRSKTSRVKSRGSKGEDAIFWAVPAFIFGFYPAAISAASIADGTLYFDEGAREAQLGIQIFEWSATLAFLIMGVSLLLISVALFAGRGWAGRAQNYWAAGSLIMVGVVVLSHTMITGEVPWEIAIVYLMYPTVVTLAWVRRRAGWSRSDCHIMGTGWWLLWWPDPFSVGSANLGISRGG